MLTVTTRVAALVLLVAASCCVGCKPAEEIRTYSVARTMPQRPPFPVEQVDQILVAILPQDEKAWFFKLVGKKPAIERQRKAFDDFMATIKLADSSADPPTWVLPEGWTERGASEMREATLLVPDGGGELELAVSSLPLTVEWDEFLVPNVKRWLRQLQCESLPNEEILKLAQETKTQSGNATVYHLAGLMPNKPMGGNPHAGLGIAPPPATARQAPSQPPKQAGALSYDTPEGWLPGRMSAMRKAAFLLPGGQAEDSVTVTSFPASGQMSDVAANVQRWAGQVGMKRPTNEEIDKLTSPITVGGHEGTYLELTSPSESEVKVSQYVAMVEREGQVWFFKMRGGTDLVASQRDAFRDFLASVKFE